jgi:hypothetical protein
MRFSKIEIYGHHRSGNHYLAALVCDNFVRNGRDYRGLFYDPSVHLDANKLSPFIRSRQSVAMLYIMRNWEDVARSVFEFRHRMGLNVEDFEEYLNKTYKEMWSENVPPFVAEVNWRVKKVRASRPGGRMLMDVEMKPEEYWKYHVNSWLRASRKVPNVMVVRYERLLGRFNPTMNQIAQFLRTKVDGFSNVEERVGWRVLPK